MTVLTQVVLRPRVDIVFFSYLLRSPPAAQDLFNRRRQYVAPLVNALNRAEDGHGPDQAFPAAQARTTGDSVKGTHESDRVEVGDRRMG
jgi:hypothetical protein